MAKLKTAHGELAVGTRRTVWVAQYPVTVRLGIRANGDRPDRCDSDRLHSVYGGMPDSDAVVKPSRDLLKLFLI